MSKKKIQRVRGNRLRLIIPLQRVTITPTGEEYEDYIVPQDATVKVTMSTGFKRFEFTPQVNGNKLIIDDLGKLTNGTYAVETIVTNTSDEPLRSKFCDIVEIVDCNDAINGDYMDYVDFIEGSVTLDAQVFWFAQGEKGEKGDKGDKGDNGDTQTRVWMNNAANIPFFVAELGSFYVLQTPVKTMRIGIPRNDMANTMRRVSIVFSPLEGCNIDFIGGAGTYLRATINEPTSFEVGKTYIVHCMALSNADNNGTTCYISYESPLSDVAYTGAFGDISNKPTTIDGYGITDAKIENGTITLGNSTITPLTEFSEQDPTVPAWAKEPSKPTYTAQEIGTYTSEEIDQKIEDIDVSDQITGKQDTLVSGENIKTVNNQSLLGSGNVEIDIDGVVYSGGDDGRVVVPDFDPEADTVHVTAQTLSAAQKQQARVNIGAAGVNDIVGIPIVNHGTSDTGTSSTSYSIAPNTLHVWGEVAALYLSLTTGEVGYVQEYMIQFTSGSAATTLSLPNTLTWLTSSTISANTTYQIRIANGCVAMVNTGAAVDISGKEDRVAIATTLPATLEAGKYYRLGSAGTLSAALPVVSDTEHAASIMIGLTASADITPALTSSASVYYQEGFEIKSGGMYEINCLFNGSYWCVTEIKFETA